VRKPKEVALFNHHNKDRYATSIFAGNKYSAITIDTKSTMLGKKFYCWGGKHMIDTVSQSAKIQGSVYEYKTGTYSRGGANNTEGVSIIDQQTDESHPRDMFV
jgi:hypothetical protein